MGCQSGTSKWKSCDSVATIIEKEVVLMGKEHSEKEKTILDSPSPKLNKSMIAYHETGDLNPVIAEFLGLSSNTDFTESELEQRIITHI